MALQPLALGQMNQEVLGPVLTRVCLDRYVSLDDVDEVAWLSANQARWPALRCVRGLQCDEKSLRPFLASDLWARLG